MKRYILSRTVETEESAITTTVDAPTREDALVMMQVVRMQDAGVLTFHAMGLASGQASEQERH